MSEAEVLLKGGGGGEFLKVKIMTFIIIVTPCYTA